MSGSGDTPEGRFGAELRRLREHAGLTARQLAQELHRAHSGIVEYERGRRLPSVEVVEQYEDYFGLTRGTLVAQRERARVERLEQPRDGTLPEHLGDDACPYKGLRAFEADDAELFFGRERQVQEALDRLARTRFIAVVGASGSGKSSFVRAGLIAAIRSAGDGERVRVVLLTPGEHPVRALAHAATTSGEAPTPLAEEPHADPDALARSIAPPGAQPIVIVVDQFEELFTLCREESERRCFVDALIAAWRDPSSPVSVIVALRADFYGRVASYPQLAAAVVSHQALIGPMSTVDLRRAIELPAARCGLQLQSGLVDTMLEDLAGEPGALPLLSHALLETWKRRRRLQLTVGGYREAGGVRGAIAQTAERTLQELPDVDRAVARSIFLSLTDIDEGAEPTGRRIDRGDLIVRPQAEELSERVLGVLADARLVSIDEDTVVVAHEALIRHWPRLRGWIDADRAGLLTHRRLTQAARDWEALSRDDGALYRGARLAAAQEWAAGYPGGLSALEREFLAASDRHEQAQRRAELDQARRLAAAQRRAKLGYALVAVVLLVGTIAAVGFAVTALDARDEADRQRDRALSQQLASEAENQIASDPQLALLLAREAGARGRTPQARDALRAVLASPLEASLPGPQLQQSTGLAFSGDGRVVAGPARPRGVLVWDLERARLRYHLPTGRGRAYFVAISQDGRLLVAADPRGVALWDLRSRSLRGRLADPGYPMFTCAFTRSAARVVCAGAHDVGIWSVRRRTLLASHRSSGPSAVSSDGSRVVTSSRSGAIRVYDTATGRLVRALGGRGFELLTLQLDAAGERLLAVHDDGEIIVRAVAGDRTYLRQRSSIRGSRVVEALPTLDPSGRWFVRFPIPLTALDQPTAWDLRTGSRRLLHSGRVSSNVLEFAPDGRKALIAVPGGTAIVDLVSGAKLTELPSVGAGQTLIAEFAPRGGRVLTVDPSGRASVWRPGITLLANAPSDIDGASFSPDGRLVAAGDGDRLWVWSARTGRSGAPIGSRITDRFGASRPVFSADGRRVRLVVGGRMHTIDPASGAEVRTPISRYVAAIAQTDTYARIDAGSSYVDVRRIGSENAMLRVRGRTAPNGMNRRGIRDADLSRDGMRLAVAMNDGTAEVWDVRRRRRLTSRVVMTGARLDAVAIRPDGRQIATRDNRGTIRLSDGPGRRRTLATGVDVGFSTELAYSPDGRLLVLSGTWGTGDDGTRLFDVSDGRRVASIDDGLSVAVDGASGRLAISGRTRPALLQRCDQCGSWSQLLERVDRRVRRPLTTRERARFLGG